MRLFFCVLALFFVAPLSKVYGQQVLELNGTLSSMKASSDASQKTEADNLKSLVYDLKPALYFQNGQLTQAEKQVPVKIITDVASIHLLSDSNNLYNQVELICIKVENTSDLNFVLNVPDLASFKKLRYIFFLCTFEACPGDPESGSCIPDKISKMIQGSDNSGFTIYYQYSIGK